MIEKLVDNFIKYQSECGVIFDEEVSIYRYGYVLLLETVVNIILSIGIGLVMKDVLSVLIFLLSFIPLRSYAGGYHANRAWQCIILSNLCVFIVLVLARVINSLNCANLLLGLEVFAGIIILLLAPVNSKNKILSSNERKFYKKIVFCILILQYALWFLLRDRAVVISLSHIIVLITMLFAYHCNRRKSVLDNSEESCCNKSV